MLHLDGPTFAVGPPALPPLSAANRLIGFDHPEDQTTKRRESLNVAVYNWRTVVYNCALLWLFVPFVKGTFVAK